ncbi:MAG: glycosyltransferase family 4 protein [Gammaproteobacteria bacterium]|nr:glycosyltransferase family 4 protein [Gammaproteobacteria bacterium]
MKNCIVIVANGLSRENVRLQPWRYLYEIARYISVGHKVVMITEGPEPRGEEWWEEGFSVVKTNLLSIRRQTELQGLIESYTPQQLWWSVTPRTIAYWPTLKKIGCEKYALITCPLYEYRQLLRASRAGVPFDELGMLWKQRLVPRYLFARMLNDKLINKIFVQSIANQQVLRAIGVRSEKLSLLRVGIDAEDRKTVAPETLQGEQARLGHREGDVSFLYFGAVRRIRGFDAVMGAFSRISKTAANARLVVLARGADEHKMQQIGTQLDQAGLTDNVTVIGGWLSREQVRAHVEACDVAVLPFVIVPSDVPIAILEALARGKPVIGTPIDGIPELIEDRGLVVDPLDTQAFSDAMLVLVEDKDLRERLGQNARDFMRNYPDWESVGRQAVTEALLA